MPGPGFRRCRAPGTPRTSPPPKPEVQTGKVRGRGGGEGRGGEGRGGEGREGKTAAMEPSGFPLASVLAINQSKEPWVQPECAFCMLCGSFLDVTPPPRSPEKHMLNGLCVALLLQPDKTFFSTVGEGVGKTVTPNVPDPAMQTTLNKQHCCSNIARPKPRPTSRAQITYFLPLFRRNHQPPNQNYRNNMKQPSQNPPNKKATPNQQTTKNPKPHPQKNTNQPQKKTP